MQHFIEAYNEVVSPSDCQKIIEYFESQEDRHHKGCYAVDGNPIVNPSVKDSTDILMNLTVDNDCSNILVPVINQCTELYREKYRSVDIISSWSADPQYNIQRYFPNQGYHATHCEDSSPDTNRVMGWSLYLNTITDGGSTVFPEYQVKIDAEAGKFVIFPAYWTHTHHGIPSPTQTKYIITGWYTYLEDFPIIEDTSFVNSSW